MNSIHRSSVLPSHAHPTLQDIHGRSTPHYRMSSRLFFSSLSQLFNLCSLFIKVSLFLSRLPQNVAFAPLVIDISFWCLGFPSAIINWHIHSVPSFSAALDVIVVQEYSVVSAIPNFYGVPNAHSWRHRKWYKPPIFSFVMMVLESNSHIVARSELQIITFSVVKFDSRGN